MKKQFLAALFALGIVMSAASANAGCSGVYIGGKAGVVNRNFGDHSETFGNRINADSNNWIVSALIGYRFYSHWRVEAEYLHRQRQVDRNDNFGIVSKKVFDTHSYMANLYFDLSPYTMFSPYVVGGLGLTNIQREWSGTGRITDKIDQDNFTWSIGAGLSAKMTNRWNIDAGYTFFNMGRFDHATIRAHEVYIGTRYVFPMFNR